MHETTLPSDPELISVIIPFYNEKDYFDECISSVLRQTYKNYEIIIINDASREEYKKKLEHYGNLYPDLIKIVHNKKNEGVAASRNKGIDLAKGKYIAFLDSDDEWMPYKLEYQYKLLKKNKINYIHGSYFVLGENEKFKGYLKAKNVNYNQLLKSCDIGLSTVMIASEICKKYKFANISTKEDYILWLNISKEIDSLFGDERLVTIYRAKKKSLSKNYSLALYNSFKVFNKFEKQNIFYSLYSVIRLSYLWFIKKKNLVSKFIYPLKVNLVKNFNNINYEKSFILVSLNFTTLTYIKFFYLNFPNIIFWTESLTAKVLDKKLKKMNIINFFEGLKLKSNINNIYLCGNNSENQIKYLNEKLNRPIKFIQVPNFNKFKDILHFKKKFENNSLIFINIPSPKQEILAQKIFKNNFDKKIFIFCFGKGISTACGEQKFDINLAEKIKLQWIWRLRFKKVSLFFIIHLFRKTTLFYKNFIINEIYK